MGRFSLAAACSLIALAAIPNSALAQSPVIQLEAKIPLAHASGRIDHMAADVTRRRLFIAELGNNTLGVVDLDQRKVAQVIRGLKEPQGVAYVAPTETLLVANAGDGSVRILRSTDAAQGYREVGRIDLGADADNIRLDKEAGRAFIGYGSGALAVIDTSSLARLTNIPLKAHPEGFQLSTGTGRILVNVPKAKEIAVVDASAEKQIASWPMTDRDNFPMALDESGGRVLVVFRNAPVLAAFSIRDGQLMSRAATCGDADDVFVDTKRRHVYVSCGAGVLQVFAVNDDGFQRIAQVPTAPGARTSLYVPELGRLFVAAPARSGRPAAILVFTLG
jgi:DNA-binding beta-propeller fold protein YncE